MNKLSLAALLPLMSLAQPLAAEESGLAVLEKRCSEQERQIRQLEEENSRLRSLLETASKTGEVKKATPDAEKSPEPAKPSYYTVTQGDTLSRIARRNGTTPQVLAKLNKLKDAGLIRPGQKLLLPSANREQAVADPKAGPKSAPAETVSAKPEKRSGSHTIKEGETFFGIARKYGLSVETLAEANPGVNPRSIRIGETLKLVPREKEAATASVAPSADPGPKRKDTAASKPVSNKPQIRSVRIEKEIKFGDFAKLHGMDPAKLNALNGLHLEPNTVLAKGSELYVSAQP